MTGQPASIPPELQESIDLWADSQPDPAAVSFILFGSRARGDYEPESDWDIALTYEGECPSTKGLPRWLGDSHIDWVPMQRSKALRQVNICSVQHAVAADGIVLHGDALPRPERNDMNIRGAWRLLREAAKRRRQCLTALVDYWEDREDWREGFDSSIAERSALTGELLCKAAMHIRGLEPRRSHSVAELCDRLEAAFPDDPLLPCLRRCDGQTASAHVSVYEDREELPESIDVSADRLADVLRAAGEVTGAVADVSSPDEGRAPLEELTVREYRLFAVLERLGTTACPPETLRRIAGGLNAGPDISDLWDRLETPTQGRDAESEGRGRNPPGR